MEPICHICLDELTPDHFVSGGWVGAEVGWFLDDGNRRFDRKREATSSENFRVSLCSNQVLQGSLRTAAYPLVHQSIQTRARSSHPRHL